jgi:hypothetical protein
VSTLQRIVTVTACLYLIAGAWRYLRMDPRLMRQWEQASAAEFMRDRHKFPNAKMPPLWARNLMIFLFVLFRWPSTIGMKAKKEDNDNGNG